MRIEVELAWADGDPMISVTEEDELVVVVADPRLSEAQVQAACAELDQAGDGVWRAWRARVGLSDEAASAR